MAANEQDGHASQMIKLGTELSASFIHCGIAAVVILLTFNVFILNANQENLLHKRGPGETEK